MRGIHEVFHTCAAAVMAADRNTFQQWFQHAFSSCRNIGSPLDKIKHYRILGTEEQDVKSLCRIKLHRILLLLKPD